MRTTAALLTGLALALSACTSPGDGSDVAPPAQLPADDAVGLLAGRLGPGVPPTGAVPAEVRLVFTRAGQRVEAVARDGRYEVALPAGTWSVTSADGRACATGLGVAGGAWQRNDLAYPADCTSG